MASFRLFDQKKGKSYPSIQYLYVLLSRKKPAEAFADYVQNTFGVDMDLTAG